jgi:murein DD-endopeptidase MepM/ murein hydrolase activator NlpD
MSLDVWPPRNLGLAEHWGREVQNALEYVREKITGVSERVQGGNRNVASSSTDLAKAITRTSELADDIEDAILATPKYFLTATSATGFGAGTTWGTIARARQNGFDGFPNAEVSAVGTVYTEQDFVPESSFVLPFPYSSVTDEYGPRPPLPFHNGIDFGQASGTPIPSSSAGTVIINQYYDDYGNYLRVDVSAETGVPGSWLGYAHMRDPSPLPVGTAVTQGQTLGLVGSTGFSTGPHLHWETAPGGDRINPRIFMDIFGGESSSTVREVQARLVINGVSSPVFKPYTEVGLGPKQLHIPIFGRSIPNFAASDVLDVALQVRAIGGRVANKAVNKATLTIEGGFRQ